MAVMREPAEGDEGAWTEFAARLSCIVAEYDVKPSGQLSAAGRVSSSRSRSGATSHPRALSMPGSTPASMRTTSIASIIFSAGKSYRISSRFDLRTAFSSQCGIEPTSTMSRSPLRFRTPPCSAMARIRLTTKPSVFTLLSDRTNRPGQNDPLRLSYGGSFRRSASALSPEWPQCSPTRPRVFLPGWIGTQCISCSGAPQQAS